jgi:hypothetical protein
MDDFSKTGMHMSENSMMMMGSKLTLEPLSSQSNGVGAKYRWYGKLVGMTIDFSESVTKWEPNKLKEWETVGEAKIIIMSWYRMWFEIFPVSNGTNAKLSITYLPPPEWLNNMLNDTKRNIENGIL